VGPRAGLDDMERRKFLTLPGLELRPLGRPARRQSPYRLRYPGSLLQCTPPNNYYPLTLQFDAIRLQSDALTASLRSNTK
jgi:hypothetical protein